MAIHLLIGILVSAGIGALLGYFGKCTSGICPLTANPFRGAAVGLILGALLTLSCGCRRSESGNQTTEESKAATSIPEKTKVQLTLQEEALIHVNSETDFKKYVLDAHLPCLTDFSSVRCPPCLMLTPIIEKLANKYKGKAVVCKVSLDHAETQSLPRPYGILGIPTVIFFSKGKETQRLIGLRSEKAYSSVLDEMIKK